MAMASAVMFRKVARIACLVLFVGLLFGGAATAQLPITAPAPVTVGSVVPFSHGSTGTWGQIYQMAVAPNGTILFLDAPGASLYALAPGATQPTLLAGPVASGGSSNCSTLEQANNSDWNSSLIVDKNNTIYIGDRYGSAVAYCVIPYVNGAWTFQASDNWTTGEPVGCTTGAGSQCTSGTEVIWPQSMAIGDDGTIYVGSSGNTDGSGIWSFTVTNGVASTPTALAVELESDASNLAVDHAGNLFFLENVYGSPSSRVDGIREIVKGSPTVVGTSGSGSGLEASLPRIDEGFQGVSGLAFDAWGNLYFGSQQNSAYGGEVNGVFMIPNEGTPKAPNLVWADTVRVSPVYSGFYPLVDPRGYLWIADGGGGSNWAPAGTIAPVCSTKTNTTIDQTCTSSSVILWAMGGANVGTSPVGTPGPVQTLYYSFSKPTTGTFTLAGSAGSNFAAVAANPSPDPTVTPAVPPCTSGATYPGFSANETTNAAYSWCQYFVQLDTKTAGSVSGEVQIVDSSGVVPGSNAYLYGVGQGSNIAAVSTTAAQSVATGLQEPGQVAGDAFGDVFVADATLGTVEDYPVSTTARPFVGTAIGTGLTAPTGVAVDPVGDLYIGDSGTVYEIPYVSGALATKEQTPLLKGLGSDLNLAADASGDVFVADKSNKQVIEIPNPQTALLRDGLSNLVLGASAGFKSPSAIATDNSGNVWVADGTDLWEITLPYGQAAEVLTGLSAPVTGLAIDPSGSIFVAESTGLWWIPYLASSGGLSFSQAVQVSSIPVLGSAPIGVGLDGFENAYVSYGSGASAGLSQVGAGGSVNFDNYSPELNPDVPFEYDALLFNLGNAPLTLSAFSGDSITGTNAGDFTVGAATENSPACGPGTSTLPGSFCYLGLVVDAQAAGLSVASATVGSNAVNAPALNVALSANSVVDPRSATSMTVVAAPLTGVVYPGSVTITVTVSAQTSSNGTPACATGVQCVSLNLTGQAKQTATLTNGVATFTYKGLGGGSYRATGGYSGLGVAGTPPDFAATGNFTTFVVAPASPTFKVAAPANASSANLTVYNGNTFLASGASDTITASVTSTVGTPTGTVTFCSSYTSGKCTPADPSQGVNGAIALSGNGTATFSTSNLGLGVYNLTAVYSGDPNFASETNALPTFEVIVPSDEVTAAPATLTITPGTPATTTLTLQPLVGFSTSVSLACVPGSLPSYTECTFGYPGGGAAPGVIPVGNNGTAPTSITITVSTNVCTGNCGITSMLDKSRTNILAQRAPWSLAGLFGLGLIGVITGRKRMKRYLALMCVAIMFSGVFMGLASCTNAGYSTPPKIPPVVTPGGTYNIQVITYNNVTGQQNSVTVPLFVIPTTVQ
jgi:hypothetical protein